MHQLSTFLCLLFVLHSFIILAQNDCDSTRLYNHYQKGLNFTRKGISDSALLSLKKAQYWATQCSTKEGWSQYLRSSRGINYNFHQLGAYDSAIYHIEQILQQIQVKEGDTSTWYSRMQVDLAALYNEKGYYYEALKIAKIALARLEQKQVSLIQLAKGHNNIGACYQNIGDFDYALHYYQQSLRIYGDTLDNNHPEVLKSWRNIGHCYYQKRNYTQAKKYLLQSIRALKINNQRARKSYINNADKLADVYRKQTQYDSSFYYLYKALPFAQKDTTDLALLYQSIGNNYFQQAQYQAALDTFQLAKKYFQQTDGTKHPHFGSINLNIGKTLHKQGQYNLALSYFQQALTAYAPNFEDTIDYQSNPILQQIPSKLGLLLTFAAKGNTLLARYEQRRNPQWLYAALNTFEKGDSLILQMRQSFQYEGSKFTLAETALKIYEGGIQAAIAKEDLSRAFAYSEKAKAGVLRAALQAQEAKLFTHLPDSLLKQESQLQTDLIFYNKKIKSEQEKDKGNATIIKNWQNKRFQKQQALIDLKLYLEQHFPDYFRYKYQQQELDLLALQRQLNTETALLNYFVGTDSLYIFTLTSNKLQLHRQKLPSNFREQITQFRQALSEQQKPSNDYFTTAFELYQSLVKPALSQSKQIKKLIIIPDDVLAYLPFEALISQKNDCQSNCYHINRAQYLLEDYTISYHYAASFLLEKNTSRNPSKGASFLGFAPFGSATTAQANTAIKEDSLQLATRACQDQGLSPLHFSSLEIDTIYRIWGGEIYLNQSATKSRFLAAAPHAQILHLSTHACLDDVDPLYNRIYFAEEALSNYELYQLQLQADLAVLSACNTGVGLLQKGEGIRSMARAFTKAGCPAIITSLWQIPDAESSNIMVYFYQFLNEGLTKDEALRQAKLAYLHAESSTNYESLPYFWAAFIPIGDMRPLVVDEGFSFKIVWWLVLLGFVGVIGLGVWWIGRR